MGKIGSFFVLIFLFSFHVFAEVSLQVDVNPAEVGKGDRLQLTLTVQGNEDLNITDPSIPETDGLTLLEAQKGPRGSSVNAMIGPSGLEYKKTATQQYIFLYTVAKAGAITIPSISIEVNGKVMATAPQKIQASSKPMNDRPRVRGKPSAPSGPGNPFDDQPGGNPFPDDDDDFFNQVFKQRQKMMEELQRQMRGGGPGGGAQIFGGPFGGQPPVDEKIEGVNPKEAFFIHLEVDKTEVYEGEQITANWYIYARGQIQSFDRAKFPDLRGFWKEIIEEVPGLQFNDALVNGVPYRKALLASHALFPIKAGTAVIDEFKIKAKVLNQLGSSVYEFTKSSKRLPIKVLPVPQEGKPQSYSGAVGQFQIQAQVDGLKFPANQPFTLKVRFEGAGNAKLIELPPIHWPNELEVFDTKSESKYYKNGQSFKEFEILLIPRAEGKIKIPQINFSYFDPAQKTYITKSTEEFEIEVTQALPGSANAVGSAGSGGAGSAGKVDPILDVTHPILQLPGTFSWLALRDQFFASVFALMILVFFGWFIKKYLDLSSAPHLRTIVNKKLTLIQKATHEKNYKVVGSEAVNLIYILLAHMAQQKNATTEWKDLIQQVPVNYREKYEAPLSETFEYFQLVGFAPENIKESVLQQRPIEPAVQNLKTLAQQLVAEMPKE